MVYLSHNQVKDSCMNGQFRIRNSGHKDTEAGGYSRAQHRHKLTNGRSHSKYRGKGQIHNGEIAIHNKAGENTDGQLTADI